MRPVKLKSKFYSRKYFVVQQVNVKHKFPYDLQLEAPTVIELIVI